MKTREAVGGNTASEEGPQFALHKLWDGAAIRLMILQERFQMSGHDAVEDRLLRLARLVSALQPAGRMIAAHDHEPAQSGARRRLPTPPYPTKRSTSHAMRGPQARGAPKRKGPILRRLGTHPTETPRKDRPDYSGNTALFDAAYGRPAITNGRRNSGVVIPTC
ncbi:MAG TPA: hypothetical protein VFY29_09295 [Terriglobia bacterium]|nr:hypothetical protein [Terriglobia bacterium]